MQAKQESDVVKNAADEAAKKAANDALAKQQDEIRKSRKALGDTPNAGVAVQLKIKAGMEYQNSSYMWCGFYNVDKFQAQLTGVALTANTKTLLDAEVLSTPKL